MNEPSINAERVDAILHMLRFISGAVDRAQLRDGMENAIKAKLFQLTQNQLGVEALRSLIKADSGDTFQMLVEAIKRQRDNLSPDDTLAKFFCISDEFTQCLAAELDALPTALGTRRDSEVATPTAAAAAEVALSNYARAITRIVLLRVCYELVELELDDNYFAVRQELWTRANVFRQDVLLFGVLAGGRHQIAALKAIAPLTFYSAPRGVKFPVIEFLQTDGYTPNGWDGDIEDALLTDLIKKYEALIKE